MTVESLLEDLLSSETASPCPGCFSCLRLRITTLLKQRLWGRLACMLPQPCFGVFSIALWNLPKIAFSF